MNYVPQLDMEDQEKRIAQIILSLATCIQDAFYFSDEVCIPEERVSELHRLYRTIMPLVDLYFGIDETPLVTDSKRGWPPRDGKFRKASK